MKRLIFLPVICSIFLVSCFSSQNAQTTSTTYTPIENNVSYQDFYDQLSPYGRWVNYGAYGNVWIPMEQGFSPYSTNGHWLYTDMGWAWQSGYQWGWAPFHYGRWIHDNNIGWAWTPGYEWAPAWVNWRGGSQYYGWSPMGPSGYQNYHDDDDWFFVERRYITQTNLNDYYINNYNQRRNIYQNSNQINNYNTVGQRRFNYGPSQQEVEAATNSRLRAERAEQIQHAIMNNRNSQENGYRRDDRRITQREFPNDQYPNHQIYTPSNNQPQGRKEILQPHQRITPDNGFPDRSVSPPQRANEERPTLQPNNRNTNPENFGNKQIQPERRFNPPTDNQNNRRIFEKPAAQAPIDHIENGPVKIISQPIREPRAVKTENEQPRPKKPDQPVR